MHCRQLGMAGFLAGLLLWSATETTWGQVAVKEQPVTLRVLLPQADAKLLINDLETKQQGVERLFSGALPSKEHYTLTAVWEPNNYTHITRTRKVTVKAAGQYDVDLRKADPAEPDKIKVRYVPTPQDVTEAMIKLGKVGEGDIVYDLGCGDGRIVITSVEKYKAKSGVGVDLDPERVADSKANAEKAGVADKVEFRQADVLEMKDLSRATVVMLYMGEDINLRLRPILQKTLKPGARVVSHRFTMGDWRPLRTEKFTASDGHEYQLHLWIIGEPSPKK